MNNFDLKFKEVICEQGSPEWFNARAGVITASKIKEVRARLKNGDWSAAAKKYAFRLAFERVSKGVLDDTYSNAYMKRGSALEEDARILHESNNNILIDTAGFFVSECGLLGASPDGLINHDGGAEYKCFLSPDELMPILLAGDVSTVMDQVQACMLATGRTWWEFFLYTPQIAGVCEKPYKIFRIERDDDYIAEMLDDLKEFDALILVYLETIAKQYGIAAQEPDFMPENEEGSDFMEDEQGMMPELENIDIQF